MLTVVSVSLDGRDGTRFVALREWDKYVTPGSAATPPGGDSITPTLEREELYIC